MITQTKLKNRIKKLNNKLGSLYLSFVNNDINKLDGKISHIDYVDVSYEIKSKCRMLRYERDILQSCLDA